MEYVRKSCGICMGICAEYVWTLNGICGDCWNMCGNCMEYVRNMHGMCMGICVEPVRNMHGQCAWNLTSTCQGQGEVTWLLSAIAPPRAIEVPDMSNTVPGWSQRCSTQQSKNDALKLYPNHPTHIPKNVPAKPSQNHSHTTDQYSAPQPLSGCCRPPRRC